jgi:hypothetical protein
MTKEHLLGTFFGYVVVIKTPDSVPHEAIVNQWQNHTRSEIENGVRMKLDEMFVLNKFKRFILKIIGIQL